MNLVEKLKKAHDMVSVEKKDLSLKDYFSKDVKQVTLKVTGFASKFVSKYCNDNNEGFHTMIYTIDENGKEIKTGAFSNALYKFASFFYNAAGMDSADFNKIVFDKPIEVSVSKIPLDGGKTTYDFDIVGGEAEKFQRYSTALTTASVMKLEGETEEEPAQEEPAQEEPTEETGKKKK